MSEAWPEHGGNEAGRERRGGFLMMDLLLALAVMALIAALALPFARAGGGAALRLKSAEIVSLLRSSRNAALLAGRPSAVTVDAAAGIVRSALPAGEVVLPRGVAVRLTPPGALAITFTPDGRASGGGILLLQGRGSASVRVNPLTAAVEIASP